MKLLTDWGFTRAGWRSNQHGEYWVLAQAFLILSFVILPIYQPAMLGELSKLIYFVWAIAFGIGLVAAVFLLKGLWDLGDSLTPLPYPKNNGQLVQTGVYSVVRHPLYSGVILAALSWTMFVLSLSHLVGTAILFTFFDAKASKEEAWLIQRYLDYPDYCQRVKKLIPKMY
ncbi:isoprenylcysteine carboxylmethyltransferase family protein [Gloeocapsopsis crepidinum LEGE 06123]|uniref:Isoprenylcysteine carboxylmethyltransferase family protein n=1 Tax=Gloeocapsopsis crepidinum LEGE 06123 TaxID=588587 RepID=A0ABR9UQ70_9CHRO|nr:isoprenylcysteine carboxylmethyltransferase family protein [Gloeocapsopsis crepidinum]MBE9190205.1 isoprenylcysteine carboxylmethyltransferase family protein [Gloeocapsopsis crepidinum LEGE 06123]